MYSFVRCRSVVPVVSILLFLLAATEAPAQLSRGGRWLYPPIARPGEAAQPGAPGAPQMADQDQEPYMLRPGLYVYPAPYSPDYWSPLMRRFPDYNPRAERYDSRESYYRPLYGGYSYDPGASCTGAPYAYPGGYSPYYGDAYSAYEQGRYDADHEYVWYIAAQRAGMLLNQYRELFEEGVIYFRDGRYDWAAIKLLGASEKNEMNGGSRLHAGHALFALGRYDEAAKLIARAYELSPSVLSKQYDIREEYGNPADFEKHLVALKTFVAAHPTDADALTLLGYVTFYTEGPGASYPYLKRAAALDPKSYFIPKLLTLAEAGRGQDYATSEEKPRPTAGAAKVQPTSGEGQKMRTAPNPAPKLPPTKQPKHGNAVDDNSLRQVRAVAHSG